MSMKATARRLHGLRHEVVVNERHVLMTDEPRALGGTDLGPTPHELLPASLATCIATTVQIYAARQGWDAGDVAGSCPVHRALAAGFEFDERIEVAAAPDGPGELAA